MSAFRKIDCRRIDHVAIVSNTGLAAVLEHHRSFYHEWLKIEGYEIHSVDCSGGFVTAAPEFGRLFRWEEQFGYPLFRSRGSFGLSTRYRARSAVIG